MRWKVGHLRRLIFLLLFRSPFVRLTHLLIRHLTLITLIRQLGYPDFRLVTRVPSFEPLSHSLVVLAIVSMRLRNHLDIVLVYLRT